MLALEARRMGYRVAVLDPDSEGPAGQVADIRVEGAFDDLEAAKTLLDGAAPIAKLSPAAGLPRRVRLQPLSWIGWPGVKL